MSERPILWQIRISHYSEKVRWALDHKGLEYERRAPPAGAHMLVAMWLTRGAHRTFPVLELHGERIGDSTAIIAALERRHPQPALYPADAGDRARALALEDWFDEELGPHIRLLAWHEITREPELMADLLRADLPAPVRDRRAVRRGAGRYASAFVGVRYRVKSEQAAELVRGKVVSALDRLEHELGDGEYLVGDEFSIADLTAATMFYPLVLPPEGPPLPSPPEAFQRFREPLSERRGFKWVADVFRRHRASRPVEQWTSASA